ncbi:MAG: MFS transporter [Ardenticatenia bacterium]|nr:MFS transporter [Ardenticatenia bacterium]
MPADDAPLPAAGRTAPGHRNPRPRLPRAIWALGFVSLLMDVSSEAIHSLLPVFMVSGLGASVLTVGLIEGAAEATALIVKVFSGVISDAFGKRKALALLGYGLGAVTKPFFALATGMGTVMAARLVDRVGKGIRGAPRDALVADIAPPQLRGAAYGLRQALDTVGALLGPLLAMGLMLLWQGDVRAVFKAAALPAFAAVLLLMVGVREPDAPVAQRRGNPIRRENLARLGPAYWWVVALGAVFMLARFSEAFLLLRAQDAGLRAALLPLVMVVMNLIYAVGAYPAGRLADTVSHERLLAIGLGLLLAADLVLAAAGGWPLMMLGVALWGLHMALTQGLLATMVADVAPPDLRGTAFGFFNLVSGMALLVASGVAGLIWDRQGATATFHAGALFCLLALAVLGLRKRMAGVAGAGRSRA